MRYAMEKEILTIADASALLSLPESEVEQLLSDGELPGRKVGRHWFISRQRLLKFIAESDSPPAPPKTVVPEGNILPPRVLGPNWRCEGCQQVHGPDLVECPNCGSMRNTPLLGYRLPVSALGLGMTRGREIN